MKTYLVSGAGSGIGKAIVEQLASEGHHCILLGRSNQSLQQTLSNIQGNHQIISADIRSVESLQKALVTLEVKAIDRIIANAGIGGENYCGA